MAENENCFNCVYSYWDPSQIVSALSGGFPLRPSCANHPDSPGRLRPLSSGRICRNYRPRTAAPEGDVMQIPVGQGLFAYVDAADFDWLNQWTWHLRSGYASRRWQGKTILMHREIVRPSAGMVVDHLNHNKLDNTRANLRNCTQRENMYNSAKRRGTTSRFRGVSRSKKRWRARIKVGGVPIELGCFVEEIDAARAHDRGAVEYRGDAACLNFPKEWPPQRRQQVHAQHAAANEPVGATHASPSAGKRKTEDQGRKTDDSGKAERVPRRTKSARATGHRPRATAARTQRKSAIANHQSSMERATAPKKQGKTSKAKRKTPAAKPRATRAARRATKKPAARRKTKSSRATSHG